MPLPGDSQAQAVVFTYASAVPLVLSFFLFFEESCWRRRTVSGRLHKIDVADQCALFAVPASQVASGSAAAAASHILSCSSSQWPVEPSALQAAVVASTSASDTLAATEEPISQSHTHGSASCAACGASSKIQQLLRETERAVQSVQEDLERQQEVLRQRLGLGRLCNRRRAAPARVRAGKEQWREQCLEQPQAEPPSRHAPPPPLVPPLLVPREVVQARAAAAAAVAVADKDAEEEEDVRTPAQAVDSVEGRL